MDHHTSRQNLIAEIPLQRLHDFVGVTGHKACDEMQRVLSHLLSDYTSAEVALANVEIHANHHAITRLNSKLFSSIAGSVELIKNTRLG